MKKIILISVLFVAQIVLAKTAVDFNTLIQNEAQSQNETHKALVSEVNQGSISEALPADDNRIVFLSRNVQMLDFSKKHSYSQKKSKRPRLSSNEKLEEDDYSKLDRELGDSK